MHTSVKVVASASALVGHGAKILQRLLYQMRLTTRKEITREVVAKGIVDLTML
jgi:hypothetical protein